MGVFKQDVKPLASTNVKGYKQDSKTLDITPTYVEVSTNAYDKAGRAVVVGIPSDYGRIPQSNKPFQVEINGERVFTGTVNVAERGNTKDSLKESGPNTEELSDAERKRLEGEDYLITVEAYDDIRRLSRRTIDRKFKDEGAMRGFKEIGKHQSRFDIDPSFDGYGWVRDLDEVFKVTHHYNDKVWSVLKNLGKRFGAVVRIDQDGQVHADKVFDCTDHHDLKHALDTSIGPQTPPYQKVVVHGRNVGDAAKGKGYLLTKNHVFGSAKFGDGQPTYHYTDNTIRTPETAKTMANQILRKMKRQQESGRLEISGNAKVRPYDTVRVPPELPKSTYFVQSVKHTIDETDGFRTELQLGGVINGIDNSKGNREEVLRANDSGS